MTYIVTVRRVVSLTLLVLWLITGVTGTLLLLGRLLARLGYVPPGGLVATLHTYAGFAALGVSVIHIALNWDALKSYIRRRKK